MLGSYVNIDRSMVEPNLDRVDVIIPVKNTKDNWENCLDSFYREIPINRLLIGDGGCTDNTIEIVRKYPRVRVLDQSKFKTLGYRIKCLIKEVETEWFVYLHSDVSLPTGWYDEMCKYRKQWDWFECRRVAVYHFEEELKDQFESHRAYSGSQMGRREAFTNIIKDIEDDYVYRMEDLLLQERIEDAGYKYGKVPTIFHYHHARKVRGEYEPQLRFRVSRSSTKDWEIYVAEGMIKGIIKYMSPEKRANVVTVNKNVEKLMNLGVWNREEWKKWVRQVNLSWEEKIHFKPSFKFKLKLLIKRVHLGGFVNFLLGRKVIE